MCPKKHPSRRAGVSCARHDAFTAQIEERPSRPNHTVPYGTEPVCYGTRHFVPSYLHSVPSGTKTVEACPPNRLHSNLPVRELSRTTATRLSSPKSYPTKLPVCRLQTSVASEVGTTRTIDAELQPRTGNGELLNREPFQSRSVEAIDRSKIGQRG